MLTDHRATSRRHDDLHKTRRVHSYRIGRAQARGGRHGGPAYPEIAGQEGLNYMGVSLDPAKLISVSGAGCRVRP